MNDQLKIALLTEALCETQLERNQARSQLAGELAEVKKELAEMKAKPPGPRKRAPAKRARAQT